MTRLLASLARLAVITTGFVAAAVAASFFFNLLMVGAIGWEETAPFLFQGPIYISTAFLAAFFGYHAFLPAMAVILLAEFMNRRDWLFHALAGGVVCVAAIGLSWRGYADSTVAVGDTGLAIVFLACGVVGGLVYWAVAGRASGRWLHDPRAPRL